MKSTTQSDNGVYMEEPETGDMQRNAIAASPNILSLPVSLTVSVGAVKISVGQLLGLRQDSVLMLDSKIDDPVAILIGERVVALGELVEPDEGGSGIGVRVTALVEKPSAAM